MTRYAARKSLEEAEVRMADKQGSHSPFSAGEIGTLSRELIMALPGHGRTVSVPALNQDEPEGAVQLDYAAQRRTQGE